MVVEQGTNSIGQLCDIKWFRHQNWYFEFSHLFCEKMPDYQIVKLKQSEEIKYMHQRLTLKYENIS